jgi:hypothetical protein
MEGEPHVIDEGTEEPMDRDVVAPDEESVSPEDEPAFAEESAITEEGAEEREAEEEEEGPRRRRRRRRRPGERAVSHEGPTGEETSVPEAEAEEPAESLEPSLADEEEDEEEGDEEAPRVYRNVPTWEEAISFLLHKRPGESRPREPESGGSRDQRRDSGR